MPDFWYCLHFVCAVFFWCYTITLRQGRWCSQWIGLSVTCLQNECEDSQIKRDQREQVQSGVARCEYNCQMVAGGYSGNQRSGCQAVGAQSVTE